MSVKEFRREMNAHLRARKLAFKIEKSFEKKFSSEHDQNLVNFLNGDFSPQDKALLSRNQANVESYLESLNLEDANFMISSYEGSLKKAKNVFKSAAAKAKADSTVEFLLCTTNGGVTPQ